MTRTIATWMAPILCFTAQDVADELGRTTGEPFDVHGGVRAEVDLPGKQMNQPNRRWTDEIRPRREAILAAAGGVPRRRPQVAGGAREASRPPPPSGPTGSGASPTWPSCASCRGVELDAGRRAPGETADRRRRGARADLPALLAAHRRGGRPGAADPEPCLRCAAVMAETKTVGANT